ncbi:hypothetical protein [Tsuneonella mangrovi]|uniref:hypothetical protein n=1 Tax=Tsuneonella mangrovi TaxID=1982042 RepID=UPI001237332F|nr:hypothetical protein [Tsuneonella mangrovi]
MATPAMAEDWDFSLGNHTGKTVVKIEVSQAGKNQWTDQKGADTRQTLVENGNDWTVHFDKPDNVCKFDFRLTYKDNSTEVYGGIDVCNDAWADLSYKDGKPVITGEDD